MAPATFTGASISPFTSVSAHLMVTIMHALTDNSVQRVSTRFKRDEGQVSCFPTLHASGSGMLF